MDRESVAYLLEHPERFHGLPKRSEFEREICLWVLPSFEPHSSWSIFRDRKTKEYFVRRLEHDPKRGLPSNMDIYGADAPISENLATEVLVTFEEIQAPMFRRLSRIGLDGTSYGVHMGNYWQNTTVRWWSSFSPEWSSLHELFLATSQRLDGLLPTSTLRHHEPA